MFIYIWYVSKMGLGIINRLVSHVRTKNGGYASLSRGENQLNHSDENRLVFIRTHLVTRIVYWDIDWEKIPVNSCLDVFVLISAWPMKELLKGGATQPSRRPKAKL
ncbi:hypothetical protein Tco_1202992 [Tanacetum coccineum]